MKQTKIFWFYFAKLLIDTKILVLHKIVLFCHIGILYVQKICLFDQKRTILTFPGHKQKVRLDHGKLDFWYSEVGFC